MTEIALPHNWRPRGYQLPAWRYLQAGGRHAELCWHRRSGKDEVALHWAAVSAFRRVAGYWHLLPEYSQARKAIWAAVNPHTGKRRIDEAFPHELRETTREQEMQIVFKNGSTWQVVGSDSYNRLVGSTPAGVTFSEWALANPAARAYLRPIIAENNGWQVFITTPRGKNHAYNTLRAAMGEQQAFAQVLSAHETGVFSAEQLESERAAYIQDYGEDQGRALFEQEYLCSFDAAILGSYYGAELSRARAEGRICRVPYDEAIPVFTAWDLGYDDDCAIWFFQVTRGEIHVIDYYYNHGKDVDFYCTVLNDRGYEYAQFAGKPFLWLPHDAKAKTLAAKGKSVQQQFLDNGYASRLVPNLSVQDGIQAVRKTFPRLYLDEERCADGIEALTQYRREWDEDRKMFRDQPVHDWTSHPSDAMRYLAIAWQTEMEAKASEPTRWRTATDMTFNEIRDMVARRRTRD